MIKHRNYFIFVIIFFALSLMIMQNFLFGILTGGLIAISVWPFLTGISKKIKFIDINPEKNAITFSFIFCCLFLIPLIFAVLEMYDLYVIFSKYLQSHGNTIQPPKSLQYLPFHETLTAFWQEHITNNFNYFEFIKQITDGKIISLSSYILNSLIEKIITFFTIAITFYLSLKNGNKIKFNYESVFASLFGDKSVQHIQNGIISLRGTINGVLLIGIIEGIILSIPLILGNIPSGFSIGIIAGILGVIPMVMPLLVLPCLFYLYSEGQSLMATIGLIDLVLVWFIFENIIKPKLISKKAKTNPFFILASMIGGIQAFGILGLFVGPAIASMSSGILKEFLNSLKTQNIK